MSTDPAPAATVARRWGLASVITMVVGLLPSVIVLLLAVTVSPEAPWLFFFTFPMAMMFAVIAGLLGVVGLFFAVRRGAGFGWPVGGLVFALLVVLGIVGLFAGWFG
jgi:heme/copper-type cytochrome/quinol oxidase subunit 4